MNNKTDKSLKIAVVGATGAVGEVMAELIAQRLEQPVKVIALASERSLGNTVQFGRRELDVEVLDDFDFEGVDFALFSAGAGISETFAPRAAAAGAVVIDNSSAFRQAEDIPLVVPEVNAHHLEHYRAHHIVSNPNCSTIQLMLAVAPLHQAFGTERIEVATYQSVSGAGRSGLEELARQTADRLNFRPSEPRQFAQPIGFNCLPQIDVMEDNGFSREEMKMLWESRRILDAPELKLNATCVRVPVFYGHAEAVHLTLADDFQLEDISELLQQAPGVELIETRDPAKQPTQLTHAAGKDTVYVSRLRRGHSDPRQINFWIVADNLRKGAALNAVQILEALLELRAREG